MARILVVDDDLHIAQSLSERLQARGYTVSTAGSGREATAKIRRENPDVVLLDLQLPEGDGLSVLKTLREDGIETTVVVITAFGTIDRAVAAMKEGAYDFIQKPFEPALIEETVKRALERSNLKRENRALKADGFRSAPLVVADPKMKEVVELAKKAAKTPSTVLLLGESGTGKEVLARSIHSWSPRAAEPFVAVSCVALNENLLESELFGHEKGSFTGAVSRRVGKVEMAQNGTLFLDEIGDISPGFQAKLLRMLQEHSFERVGGNDTIQVDVRVVAATHRDLKKLVAEGKFREDLYYRLNVISVPIPPLRDRRAEIGPLADHFLAEVAREHKRPALKFAPATRRVLELYAWPGNVRELRNAVERAGVLTEGDEVTPGDLPGELVMSPEALKELPAGFHAQVENSRRRIVQDALEKSASNQTKAAEILGLQRTYLARLIKQMGL